MRDKAMFNAPYFVSDDPKWQDVFSELLEQAAGRAYSILGYTFTPFNQWVTVAFYTPPTWDVTITSLFRAP